MMSKLNVTQDRQREKRQMFVCVCGGGELWNMNGYKKGGAVGLGGGGGGGGVRPWKRKKKLPVSSITGEV